ncbi:MAG: alpha/beta hydrolase-fold protein [Bacteroidales bacterium]|jgi:predicted alpha/beta superfamily hydrolase|nr:alpha/beta hydrolase-fold protein [Bacteroidales bacterium]
MRQVFALILILSSINIFAQDNTYSVDTVNIESTVLNESRIAIVYKPFNVEQVDSVKFLYLLDGENSNNLYQQLDNQFGKSISDMIVVGIINHERRRDMLYINGADKFLEFLTTELKPIIEGNYKVKRRILNGHSFCGSFTIFSMLNKPEYFDSFIASSPTPIMDLINTDSYLQIDNLSKTKISFYFSYGSKDMKQVQKWSKKLKENLTGQEFEYFDWKFEILEGKTHNDSDNIALFHGLGNL